VTPEYDTGIADQSKVDEYHKIIHYSPDPEPEKPGKFTEEVHLNPALMAAHGRTPSGWVGYFRAHQFFASGENEPDVADSQKERLTKAIALATTRLTDEDKSLTPLAPDEVPVVDVPRPRNPVAGGETRTLAGDIRKVGGHLVRMLRPATGKHPGKE